MHRCVPDANEMFICSQRKDLWRLTATVELVYLGIRAPEPGTLYEVPRLLHNPAFATGTTWGAKPEQTQRRNAPTLKL